MSVSNVYIEGRISNNSPYSLRIPQTVNMSADMSGPYYSVYTTCDSARACGCIPPVNEYGYDESRSPDYSAQLSNLITSSYWNRSDYLVLCDNMDAHKVKSPLVLLQWIIFII